MRWSPIRSAVCLSVLLHGCNGLFYYPDSFEYRDASSFTTPCEEVTFPSSDGTRLHGWLVRAKGDGPAKGTVIHFHGNAQNLTSHIGFVDWLPGRGFNLFAFDYRGYGRSAGSPSREGLHQDCLAAIAYVRSRPDLDPARLLVFAQSLGGACAMAALGEEGTQSIRAAAVDSTFATYIGMGNEVLGGSFLTFPLTWLLLSNRHSPAPVIERISPVPILFFHSREDPVVPLAQGRALFARAREPKEFVEVVASGHATAMALEEHRERLTRFFESALPAAGQ